MGILHRCCFCCDVRQGSMYCGIYCLVHVALVRNRPCYVLMGTTIDVFADKTTSLLFLSLMTVRFVGYKILQQTGTLPGIAFAIIGVFVVETFCTVLLLIGIYKDWRHLITPWLLCTIISMVLPTCGFIAILVTSLWNDGEIHGWDVGISAFHFCNSIILIYCVLCVISQLQDLVRGKGTAEAYRRRRDRRRMMRGFAEMHLPLDVELDLFQRGLVLPPGTQPTDRPGPSPPPYSESPPLYRENAAEVTQEENSSGRNNATLSSGVNTNNDVPEDVRNRAEVDRCETLEERVSPGRNTSNGDSVGDTLTASINNSVTDVNETSEECNNYEHVIGAESIDHVGRTRISPDRPRVSPVGVHRQTSRLHQQEHGGNIDIHPDPVFIHTRGSPLRRSHESQRHGNLCYKQTGDDFKRRGQRSRPQSQTRATTSRVVSEQQHNGMGTEMLSESHCRVSNVPAVSLQSHRTSVESSPTHYKFNHLKRKAQKLKRSNEIVLRSYERNGDPSDSGFGVRSFEYSSANREGVFPM